MPDAARPLLGMGGGLISPWYAADAMAAAFEAQLGADTRDAARRAFRAWWQRAGRRLGPVSSLRTIERDGADPVLEVFGLLPGELLVKGPASIVRAFRGSTAIPIVITTWGTGFDQAFHRARGRADTTRCPWVMGFDGRVIRLWDASRGWERAFVEFDLERLATHDESFAAAWALLRREALENVTARIVRAAREHGLAVTVSLRDGVRDALGLLVGALARPPVRGATETWRAAAAAAFEQSLTVIYRILFLLFAESRGLLPTWHRTYRRSYSMEALREKAESPRRHTGLWASLQALSRLAHAGCQAGNLVVTPFNGRLFAPAGTPLGESSRLDDELVARVIVAMTTTTGTNGRTRIAFGDLDVEQLGAVYERVLDYEPVPAKASAGESAGPQARVTVGLAGCGIVRKASGTFYTPRNMTEFLVRRALEPLVAGRTAEHILGLRVLDPAMGSGAFLVAACRFLATAYERALVAEHGRMPGDVTEDERAGFRRLVAQRCLYGVDINPTAVQVARLSLWLATLAADKPLTFLDHRLAAGNSLVGAGLEDLARQGPGRRRSSGPRDLPLFPSDDAEAALVRALPLRTRLAGDPDDDINVVRSKERLMASLREDEGGLARWRRLADLWCAPWFWDDAAGVRPDAAVFSDLARAVAGTGPALPAPLVKTLLGHVWRLAGARRFFHWTLEFPEVFYDGHGRPRPDAGFDAIITNPPWDMARGDLGSTQRRAEDRARASRLVTFARRSGIYPLGGDGHVNLYQLFVERCLTLARPGGRVGLVVPWGLLSDCGSRRLREALLDRCRIDTLVGFDNHEAVFPVHRGVRFALVSVSVGSRTRSIPCRCGLRDLSELSPGQPPAGRGGPAPERVTLTPARLERLSGPARAVPYVRQRLDLRILESLTARHPALGATPGWALEFGRELNATEDRQLMTHRRGGCVVVEGKHIQPFRLTVPPDALRVDPARQPRGGPVARAARAWRLAYRDVTGVSNRLALIAALVPPGHVTVHTAICLKSPLPLTVQAYLCAVLNSAVANFVARAWVTTHVGAGLMERMPVPRPAEVDPSFVAVARLALRLRESATPDPDDAARVQAAVGRLYGLDRGEFAHVLRAFPAAAGTGIQRCLEEWERLGGERLGR